MEFISKILIGFCVLSVVIFIILGSWIIEHFILERNTNLFERVDSKIFIAILIGVFLFLVCGAMYLFKTIVVIDKKVDKNLIPNDILKNESGFEITTTDAWEAKASSIGTQLQAIEYGIVPDTSIDWSVEKTILENTSFDGKAQLELWVIKAPNSNFQLHVVALFPQSNQSLPLLVGSGLCPNHILHAKYDITKPPHYPAVCDSDYVQSAVSWSMGEFTASFPLNQFVDNNIILASVYLGEGVADDSELAKAGLAQVGEITGQPVSGALAAWAWQFIEITKVFEKDNRVDSSKTAIYGHSRYGKAALLAGAYSDKVDLVLAHQSGKGGAALWKSSVGESLKEITKKFPHWFTKEFENYSGREKELPLDQHHLLSLLAPRPVLLSVGQHDQWGDPVSVRAAALAAAPIWKLYGRNPLSKFELNDFNPEHDLAFFIRPGNHGTRESDWEAFFKFMNRHFKN